MTDQELLAFYGNRRMWSDETLLHLRAAFEIDAVHAEHSVERQFCRHRVGIIDRVLERRQSEGVRMDEEPAC